MLGWLIILAAGLEGGVDGISAPDLEHGVAAELDVALSARVSVRGFYRFEGFGHGELSEGSITDVAAGVRADLTDGRVRPFATLLVGDAYIAVRPKDGTPEYTYSSLWLGIGGGMDVAIASHFGVRPEVRFSFGKGDARAASPGAAEVSAALLFYLSL